MELAEFVVGDLDRLARREVIREVDRWRDDPHPASAVIEAPVYRREVGLWEHQKYFVKLAFDAHRGPHGARFVLADQVGLGKTLQLAMAAQLMALVGERPVLVLAPKSLVGQWQGELDTLLGLPSAVWDGQQWLDERGVEHPGAGPESIRRCPRRIGIVSTGLISRRSEAVDLLAHNAVRMRDSGRGTSRAAAQSRSRYGVRAGGSEQSPAVPVGDLLGVPRACYLRRRHRSNSIRSRRTICSMRWPVARRPCSADRAAGGAEPRPRSVWCSATSRCRPDSMSVGNGGAIPCRHVRRGAISKSSAAPSNFPTRRLMRRGALSTTCGSLTGSASCAGSTVW